MNANNGERNGAARMLIVDDDCAVRLSVRQIFARDDRFAVVVSEHARGKDAIRANVLGDSGVPGYLPHSGAIISLKNRTSLNAFEGSSQTCVTGSGYQTH